MNRSKLTQPPASPICSARRACMRAQCSACASCSMISRCNVIAVSCVDMKSSVENYSLQGQVVLITGGARRVGAEIARTLHAAGANIFIHYRSSAAAASALADQFNQVRPHSAAIHAAHLSAAEAPEKLVAAALPEYGRLDILINSASSLYPAPLGQIN